MADRRCPIMTKQPEYLTVAEAKQVLHVSRNKMGELIRMGILPTEPNPLDRRSKLIKRTDVEVLAAKQPAALKGAA
jgi:hypothetical protein